MLVPGEADAIGEPNSTFHAIGASGAVLLSETASITSQEGAVGQISRFLADGKIPILASVGHRAC